MRSTRTRRHAAALGRSAARLIAGVALTVSTLALAPTPAVAVTYPSFTFTGFGWGHGVGMSQWGAKGFAEQGKSWQWISTYYFPGSYLEQLPDDITVVVHLTNDMRYQTQWTLSPGQAGKRLQVAGTYGKPDESFVFRYDSASGKVKATGSLGTVISGLSTTSFRVKTDSSPKTIKVAEASGYKELTNRLYRGELELRTSGGKLQLRNVLGMEGYIKGVLPGEMGSAAWDMDALKTQAVCARSYAYIKAYRGAVIQCDTDDQVYLGYSSESDMLNEAVDGTSRTVVRHSKAPLSDNRVVQTFFHSSSGGHTARIEDIWPGTGYPSTSYPYYGGVDDPYCDDAGSPNDPWPSVTKNGLQVAAAIAPKISGEPVGAGTTVWVKSMRFNRFVSGHVSTVDITWSNGAVSTGVSGSTFAGALGLKSRKFYIGVPYDRISAEDRYATSVTVSKSLFPAGSTPKAIVVANGADEKFADSLTAAGLAGAAKGAVLLTYADALPPSVRTEIGRLKELGATTAYIVGGVQSVSTRVESALRGIVGTEAVIRLAGNQRYGTDRFGTAASVAMQIKALGASTDTVLVASGETWTDAAVAGAASAGSGCPVLLTREGALPLGTARAIDDLGAARSVVYGGPKTVSDAVVSQVCAVTGESAPYRRFGRAGTRYDVAVESAQWCQSSLGYSPATVYVTSGEAFPDAVTGGVLAGTTKRPLVMTNPSVVPKATEAYLLQSAAACERLRVVGGAASVSDAVVRAMALLLD